jgi:DNA-binding NtrC family response regulator
LLLVSPSPEDHQALQEIMADSDWTIQHASTLWRARQLLREDSVMFIICERDVPPGTWRDVLREAINRTKPLSFILTSRHADDHLWAEALNMGAYDVLAKPFQASEVMRTLEMAFLHWKYRHETKILPAQA